MYLYGTGNSYGVPVTVHFRYDGTALDWGTTRLYSMSPISNSSQSIDGDYRVSDMDVEFIDTDESVWNRLGHGSTCFGKSFSATAYIGGTMSFESYGPQSQDRLRHLNLNQSATFVIHSGKVTEVNRKNRIARIRSKNNMQLISDLEWTFPFTNFWSDGTNVGSYVFFPVNFGTTYPNSLFGRNEEGDEFECVAAVATANLSSIGATYPTIAGRGTNGLLSDYTFPGTQFYLDFPRPVLKGSWLPTVYGTIRTDEEARRYGFENVGRAESARTISGNLATYAVNKTRFKVSNGTLPTGTRYVFQQNFSMENTPGSLFEQLLTGHCVSPYFTSSDLDTVALGTSMRVTAYQAFSQVIDPTAKKVSPYLKNLVESVYGNFNISPQNKFVFNAYGPRNLQDTIQSIGSSDIIDAEVTSSIEDYCTRVKVSFAFDPDSGEFKKTVEKTSAGWSTSNDTLFEIESKWIQNQVEADIFAQRLIRRLSNGVPKVRFTTPLKYAGAELGSLFKVTDADTMLNEKVVELTGYQKDFLDERTIAWEGMDGDAVYLRKGYGFWMNGTDMPSGNVSGTSTFGWGTSGTQANINTVVYGTMFSWW